MTPEERDTQLATIITTNIIALGRVYDLLLCMYQAADPQGAQNVLQMHTEGKMFFPPPAISTEELDE